MSKIILDTEDFFQNDGYDDLMHIDHESYCCGEMFEKYETKISDLEAKLAESEEQLKEEIEEKNGVRRALSACNRQNDEFSDMIKKLVNEKEELKQQLAEKDIAIENWQTMYKSVVQTCHNDKEEIERLNKRLETQENTITNLVEDNRASQEWYRKQLVEKDKEIEYQESMKILAVENQNKKAIEQLEKVKEHNDNLICDDEDYYNYITAFIDNQINELKGKVE